MPSPSQRALPTPTPGVMYQPLDDGAVLFSLQTEVYFGLNHVGATVWELLPPATDSFAALCDAMRVRYPDAPPEALERDVAALLADLEHAGLVARPADAE